MGHWSKDNRRPEIRHACDGIASIATFFHLFSGAPSPSGGVDHRGGDEREEQQLAESAPQSAMVMKARESDASRGAKTCSGQS